MVNFEKYRGIPYDFKAFPGVVDIEYAEALNCISLVHLVLWKEFWASLPTGMWASEIKTDEEFLRTLQDDPEGIKNVTPSIAGDIFIFGAKDPRRKDPGNTQVFHLALHTGDVDEKGDPLLLHTTDLNGGVSTIWPLREFGRFRRYERLYAVKRHKALESKS